MSFVHVGYRYHSPDFSTPAKRLVSVTGMRLQNQFETIIEEIEYEPIFNSGTSLLADFPQNKRRFELLRTFWTILKQQRLLHLMRTCYGRYMRNSFQTVLHTPKIAETLTDCAIPTRGEKLRYSFGFNWQSTLKS